jgi:hypothetical protein
VEEVSVCALYRNVYICLAIFFSANLSQSSWAGETFDPNHKVIAAKHKWLTCNRDEDCTTTQPTCGNICKLTSVNKNHVKDYEDYRTQECKPYENKLFYAVDCQRVSGENKCVKGQCSFIGIHDR